MCAEQSIDLLLRTMGTPVAFPIAQTIFRQGSVSDSVFYIQEGKVKLSVMSTAGREAIVGILEKGDFFGEGSLLTQSVRMETATPMTYCRLLRIGRQQMSRALRQSPQLADVFLVRMLARSIYHEQNFIDQMFNCSEKRLARILLLLAQFGEEGSLEAEIPHLSQGALAEMVGTTRSRINLFMNRFRASGFVNYGKRGIRVHGSLRDVFLKD